jgi:hypothetical protein
MPAPLFSAMTLTVLALGLTLGTTGCGGAAEDTTEPQSQELAQRKAQGSLSREAKFEGWLERVREKESNGADLYYAYYDTALARPWFLSPMISAEVLRYQLRRGNVAQARRIGDALLRWQHDGSGAKGERIKGAFPSEIEKTDSGFAARYLYDSSDSLAVMQALLELSEATRSQRYLEAARLTGVWLRDVMSHGEVHGVWLSPLGAPMKAVTAAGDFDNRIGVGRTLFWLPALDYLSRLTGDASFAELSADARALLSLGQLDNGGFADNYDPGWPAQPFDIANFRAYGEDGSVVADDSIRGALAALHEGDDAAARSFGAWLITEQGKVPGYLTLASGEAHFPAGNAKYYDIFSCALYERLGSQLGDADAELAARFVQSAQAADGGWFWGWDAAKNAAVDSNQSTLTGIWALVDLSPPG